MTEIDLCFVLNGPHLEAMLPIVMDTMSRFNHMDGVNLHFVDKGCSRKVLEWLAPMRCRVHPAARAPEPEVAGEGKIIEDVYQTMHRVLDRCGVSEWVFISHFDLEYRGPLLDYYRGLIAPDVAQIGAHATGLVGYNREALKECGVTFAHLDDCFIVKEEDTGFPLWKIRHSNDPRCTSRDMPVSGWDVGELAELRLLCNKKKVLSETETALQRFRVHNGSGCGRCVDANAMIHDKTMEALSRLGLQPIR